MTNFLTEEQAREQPCPHFRVVVNASEVSHNCNVPIYGHPNCAASDCGMAWRWFVASGQKSPVGYCGISGRPER